MFSEANIGRLCSLVVLLLAACRSAPSASGMNDAGESKSYVFKHEGIVRDVGVFDPRLRTDEGLSRPMVVVLHGGLGDDDDVVALTFGKLNKLAAEDDFLVVYPQGIGGHWNDGRNAKPYVAQREGVNDVGFLATLIGNLVERRNVDPDAVFLVGVSDGAMMTHRFACERTNKLRGFAAIIGAMPYEVARRRWRCGKEPLSALMINGTEDPIVPWDGGMVHVSKIPDFVPTDGTRIERHKATGCAEGTKVELFAVEGAGHTWPSGWQYLPKHMIGPTSQDINAATAAWRFFQSTL